MRMGCKGVANEAFGFQKYLEKELTVKTGGKNLLGGSSRCKLRLTVCEQAPISGHPSLQRAVEQGINRFLCVFCSM